MANPQHPFGMPGAAAAVLPTTVTGKILPAHFPTPTTIEWSALKDVQPLRNAFDVSYYTAKFDGAAVVVKTPANGLQPKAIFDVTSDLKHEAAVLAGVNHPHIGKLFGHGTIQYGDTVAYFIVVERLTGGTVQEQIKASKERNPRVRSEQAIPHLAAIADALWYLHYACCPGHIIVHRDLKTESLGFSADGTIKLSDFGLSAIIPHALPVDGEQPATEATQTETFGVGVLTLPGSLDRACKLQGQTGSIRYMAPEVAMGEQYDESVDPFSLSLVAWEMLHLKKPYVGLNVEAHRRVVCVGGAREEIDRQVHGELASLMKKCWEKEPLMRPTCLKMFDALASMAKPKELPNPSMSLMVKHRALLAVEEEKQKKLKGDQKASAPAGGAGDEKKGGCVLS